ncbi:hypothetical protein SAMN02745164_00128 [Marinitoga hydrogenitolerans DSM 16785]|uniref:Uncharacterized protein n=1 Tax=Marinitoga hydrogenitolerans (strain DSM 16785 / JCM 12826 / AT1271) TaxID=1122195 RepID=A0A1M4S8J9_MARH1|nr:hypothetical protein [Marinitoga hydrogenitolerans]SHE28533.1 hypothetical protein SAMN02745164_00128 [Marinitoga hydrogenitolerans DSM 16785]
MEKQLKFFPGVNQKTIQQVKSISATFVIFSFLIITIIGFVISTLNFGNKIQTLKNNVSVLNSRLSDYHTKIQTVSTELEFYKQALIVMEED